MNTEARREYARRWAAEDRKRNPEKYRRHAEKYRVAAREWARLDRKLNPVKYQRKSWKQRGYPEPTRPCPAVCEVCGDPPGKKSLNLEHCHLTWMFRGWLCSNCNTALGLLKESSDRCIALARYIRSWELIL